MKFEFPLPPTLNQCYRIQYKKRAAKDWEHEAGQIVMVNRRGKSTLTCDLEVFVTMYLKRDRDIDSSLKLLLDVFEEMGVYKNDKQIKAIHVYKEKGEPMLEVSIDEME